jgi:hypothetical protein
MKLPGVGLYVVDAALLESFFNNKKGTQPLEVQRGIVPLNLAPVEQEMLYAFLAFFGGYLTQGVVDHFAMYK